MPSEEGQKSDILEIVHEYIYSSAYQALESSVIF